jgi:HK97 family phage prohead protease
MNKGIEALTRRLSGAVNKRVFWTASDMPELARIYGVSEEEALDLWRKSFQPKVKTGSPIIKATGTIPSRWHFTASDGKVDRDRDIVNVDGIDLSAYRLNPIWHADHNYSKPIGRSVEIEKRNGKLVGVMELGLGIYPDADFVGKALAANMLKGCSIGFDPVTWRFNEQRDGIDFYAVSLREISTCSVQANYGSVIHGPAPDKSHKELAEVYRAQAKADLAYAKKAKRDAEIEARMASTTPQQRLRQRQAELARIKGAS